LLLIFNFMAVYNQQYVNQYKLIHENSQYGISGYRFIDQIQLCIAELNPSSVLDFGCGQTDLSGVLNLKGAKFFRFDPAIDGISKLDVKTADFVINTCNGTHSEPRHRRCLGVHTFTVFQGVFQY
jgi:hypothetical protein